MATPLPDLLAALAAEADDLGAGLLRLQELPLLPGPAAEASGAGPAATMMALQDLDRLTQTAGALSAMLRGLAGIAPPASLDRGTLADVLGSARLWSVQARMRDRLDGG